MNVTGSSVWWQIVLWVEFRILVTKCHLALACRRLADQAKQGGSEEERGRRQMSPLAPDKLILFNDWDEGPANWFFSLHFWGFAMLTLNYNEHFHILPITFVLFFLLLGYKNTIHSTEVFLLAELPSPCYIKRESNKKEGKSNLKWVRSALLWKVGIYRSIHSSRSSM